MVGFSIVMLVFEDLRKKTEVTTLPTWKCGTVTTV